MAAGCKRKNRLFKQFQTADAALKQWNRSKEVPANQGSNAIGAEQTKLAFTAGMAETERHAGARRCGVFAASLPPAASSAEPIADTTRRQLRSARRFAKRPRLAAPIGKWCNAASCTDAIVPRC
jgi:hypothetical protein